MNKLLTFVALLAAVPLAARAQSNADNIQRGGAAMAERQAAANNQRSNTSYGSAPAPQYKPKRDAYGHIPVPGNMFFDDVTKKFYKADGTVMTDEDWARSRVAKFRRDKQVTKPDHDQRRKAKSYKEYVASKGGILPLDGGYRYDDRTDELIRPDGTREGRGAAKPRPTARPFTTPASRPLTAEERKLDHTNLVDRMRTYNDAQDAARKKASTQPAP